jgi:hypothetical protein
MYEHYFSGATPRHRALIDGTTTYMADPRIASRIRACLGSDPKFIFVLRSPVARTYSGFLHMLKRGHERRVADEVFLELPENLELAMTAERASLERALVKGRITARPYCRIYDDTLWNYRYVGNSAYSYLIQHYSDLFGDGNILILLFEDLTRNPDASRHALGAFLDVDPGLFPPSFTRSNVTRIPDLSSTTARLIEQTRWIKRGNFALVRPGEIAASPQMPTQQVREKLNQIFAAEVAYWSGCLGRDLTKIGWS